MLGMRQGVAIVCLILFASWPPTIFSDDHDAKQIATELRLHFSEVDEQGGLFEAGGDYIIHPVFGQHGVLVKIEVVPKYFFHDRHPQWSEPDVPPAMSTTEYRTLLTLINSANELGDFVSEGKVGITLNLQTTFFDEFREGLVERTTLNVPAKGRLVTRFTIHYLREISGKVESKDTGIEGCRVRIGGRSYWTPTTTFRTLSVGRDVSIRAAGPFGE